MKNSENQIQAAFHTWLWNNYPNTRGLCYAIPNGALRSAATGSILKATGLVAFIPDYHIAIGAHGYNGLYIEFKTPEANLNTEHVKNQLKAHDKLRGANNKVIMCNDAEEAKRIVLEYLAPTGYLNKSEQTKIKL